MCFQSKDSLTAYHSPVISQWHDSCHSSSHQLFNDRTVNKLRNEPSRDHFTTR